MQNVEDFSRNANEDEIGSWMKRLGKCVAVNATGNKEETPK